MAKTDQDTGKNTGATVAEVMSEAGHGGTGEAAARQGPPGAPPKLGESSVPPGDAAGARTKGDIARGMNQAGKR